MCWAGKLKGMGGIMLTIELTKDKFGETITITEFDGKSVSYAERNWSEYSKFCEYRKLLNNDRKMTVGTQ